MMNHQPFLACDSILFHHSNLQHVEMNQELQLHQHLDVCPAHSFQEIPGA
jgi:hypothetical protein